MAMTLAEEIEAAITDAITSAEPGQDRAAVAARIKAALPGMSLSSAAEVKVEIDAHGRDEHGLTVLVRVAIPRGRP